MLEFLIILLILAVLSRQSHNLGGCLDLLVILCLIPLVMLMLPLWAVIIGLIVLASAGH
jgi:hypothetical protein